MKVIYEILEKYTEPEVHLCVRERNRETEELFRAIEQLTETRIVGYRGQVSELLSPGRIVRIYAESKKVFVRTEEECFEVKDRLYVLEEQLKEQKFVRISNSELVNVQQIAQLDMSYAGTIRMQMRNGDVTFVSRRYVKKIKDVLC
ncbi:MAG: LytTR family transcriptional regulator [Lachnospiraceae bacterium]|nr:LytTR family transcriptional regulator [Lachnospiraceae bacterium]